jgi:hypothetical protein
MKASVLILGTAVLAQFSVCFAEIPLTVQDLPQYGVSLIPSTNPAFEGYVQNLLGGAADPAVETVKPYAVILRNESGTDVVGYSLRWLWTDSAGRTTFHDVFYHNLNTPTNSSYRLPSGSAAFVSRDFAFVTYAQPFRLSPSQLEDISRMRGQTAITISLDAVVFADGRFVGPDEARGYSRALAATQGEKALMGELLSMHSAGQTDADVFQWLSGIASAPLPGPGGIANMDWQAFHTRMMAKALLGFYKNSGSARVFAIAAKRVAATDLAIDRVAFNSN